MKEKLIFISITILIFSCAKLPSVNMTDIYIEVNRPGDRFGIVELEVSKLDSTFGYPIEEKDLVAYTLVNRVTHETLSPNGSAKVYFNVKNKRYCWRIWPEKFSANKLFVDTIYIKPYTWYRVTTARVQFDLYFYIDAKTGTYIKKYKPFPGAY